MIRIKTLEEIEILSEGGKILSKILSEIVKATKPGVITSDLEKMARDLIAEVGGKPAFLGYKPHGGKPYPAALCVSVNDAVVHTPATLDYEIKDGDIVSLDLGMFYKGLCTDMATTVIVGKSNKEKQKLLDVTKESLKKAICACRVGAPISVIGRQIESVVSPAGFGIVRDLVGHGVGSDVHEDPMVPNFYEKAFDKIIMKEGLVIAIEPMITSGNGMVFLDDDGFTYRTKDGAPAAHFEATIAITKNGPVILTPIV